MTHNALQIFDVDKQGFVRRHDYTAEVFGSRAHAAHYSDGHERCAGLVFPARRRVYPRTMNNRPRRWIRLVGIDITEIQVNLDEHTAKMD